MDLEKTYNELERLNEEGLFEELKKLWQQITTEMMRLDDEGLEDESEEIKCMMDKAWYSIEYIRIMFRAG